MPRKVIKTIRINNGSLTYEVDDNGGRWYRNGKPVSTATYKFYDSSINRYRTLDHQMSLTPPTRAEYDGQMDYTPFTPIWMENVEKLRDLSERNNSLNIRIAKNKTYPTGDRTITLRTKGKMNLAEVPINMLDSIAINTGRSNTDIKTNLGLVGKEDTFGGFAPLLGKPLRDSYVVNGLVNNHAWHDEPYTDYYKNIMKQLYDGNRYDDNLRIKLDNDVKYHLERGIKPTTLIYDENNVLVDAFMRYLANPEGYNPGQKNYVPMVNNIANEVWNEPLIQNWWKAEGINYYNKGKSESKK